MISAITKPSLIFITVLSLLSLQSNSLFGQTITEGLGAVKTNFLITSDSIDLKPIDQIVVKRGEGSFYESSETLGEGAAGYAYGIGRETFHFELFLSTKIRKRYSKSKGNRGFYLLQFYNSKDELLCTYRFNRTDVAITLKKESPLFYIYSFNFETIPVVILDHTSRINIVELANKR